MRSRIKLGVSLYSYQQSRFFKELMLEDQIREVGENLPGADGIEIVDEMSLRYPDPGEDFVREWLGWMDRYGTTPVTMDVSYDVLQFRDHVMSYDEIGERLARDMRLAKRLGFRNVRCISTFPFEVMEKQLPLAEELDIRLGREIHQPMRLEDRQAGEIIDYVKRTGTRHLGIIPDFGIFGFRPPEVLLAQYERRGSKPEATAAANGLADLLRIGDAPFDAGILKRHTSGNLRVEFKQFVNERDADLVLVPVFTALKAYADEKVPSPSELDYLVVCEALMLSHTSVDLMRELAKHVVSCHGKFNYMSEMPDRPGEYHEATIDYDGAIGALIEGGFTGYINSEYEGQRYFQDRTRADMMDEVDQVRRHHSMLRRLTGADA